MTVKTQKIAENQQEEKVLQDGYKNMRDFMRDISERMEDMRNHYHAGRTKKAREEKQSIQRLLTCLKRAVKDYDSIFSRDWI